MKKVIVLFSLFVLVISAAYLVVTMPYRFYYTFQDEGIQSDYFLATSNSSSLIKGLAPYEQSRSVTPFWKSVHYQDYEFDLPFNDVTFQLFPAPSIYKGEVRPYFDIVDYQLRRVLNVTDMSVSRFNNSIPMDKIFSLPIVTKFIKPASNKQVWLDVLNLNLKMKKVSLFSYSGVKYLYENYPLSKLGYFLYIYKLRSNLFSSKATKIVQNGPFHVISFFDKEGESQGGVENLFYEKGRLYRMAFTYNRNYPEHQVVVNKLLKNMKLSLSRDEESSLEMYNEFRKLSYQKRFEYKGMVLLYSAWSHELENSSFYKEMIYYLEKGQYKTAKLYNLYDFAKKKFGQTFSSRDEILRTDLKAKIELESKKEDEKKERDLADYQIDGDTEFKSEDDKIDYILKNVDIKKKKDDLSEY